MAAPSEETPPPTVNARRPNLQERAAQRYQKPSGGFLGFLLRTGTLAAVVFGGVYFYHDLQGPRPGLPPASPAGGPQAAGRPPAAGPAGPSPVDDEEQNQRQREFETAQGVLKQRLALAKLKQKQVLDLGGQVGEAVAAWRAELDRWDDETAALLRNDKGKALAANTPNVKMFRAVYDAGRPGREEAERLTALAEGVVSAVKVSHDNPDDEATPSDEMLKQLQGLLHQARESRDTQRQARERIDALVVRATTGGSAGTKSLADAVQEQAEEERLAEAAGLAEKTRQAREEAAERVAVAKADQIRAQEEATERVIRAKADQIREVGVKQEALARAETEALKARKERERIRRLAEDPAIQARFAPFLAAGKYQYNLAAFGDIPEPASYKMLERCGHLKDVTAFAHAMAGHSYLGSGVYHVENDRPHWALPTSQAEMRQMEQFLTQFKELAPTWIEMGKLRP